jgi:hypothetical protein
MTASFRIGPQAREGPVLVGAGKPAVADDIGDQNRRELPCLAHSAFSRQAED